MNHVLTQFLRDVAQGCFGDTKLTYTDIEKFNSKASEGDFETLKDFFWDWSSELTGEDEIDVAELEEFIYGINSTDENMKKFLAAKKEAKEFKNHLESQTDMNYVYKEEKLTLVQARYKLRELEDEIKRLKLTLSK